MIAVIFEVEPEDGQRQSYLDMGIKAEALAG